MQPRTERLELGVLGMDCAECAIHIEQSVHDLPGIHQAQVLLAAERLVATYNPTEVSPADIAKAVERAGYRVQTAQQGSQPGVGRATASRLGWLLAGLVSLIILVELVGERLGLFESAVRLLPPWVTVLAVVLGGYPIFLNVARALRRGQVTAHALMTLGVIGALTTGEFVAAALIVFFMRVADYLESATTERSRHAIRSLMRLAPDAAHLLTAEGERDIPVMDLTPGQIIVVRPGERCPVDGLIQEGRADVDQSPVTGESMPVEKGPGAQIFAGAIVHGGALRLRVARVGPETTLARIARLAEQAEANKAPVQRLADRFTAWYIPVVAGTALLTYLISRNLSASMAVLLVACACAVALATPTAVIASVGRAAREGLLIKGGRYLELLARADTLVMDKTGTLTLGRPAVTDILSLNGAPEREILEVAAIAERFSEHPVAEAVRLAARAQGASSGAPRAFQALPGMGVRADLPGGEVIVGSLRLLHDLKVALPEQANSTAHAWEQAGKTVFYVAVAGEAIGALAVADTLRSEVRQSLTELRQLGLTRFLLLTGDNERTARALADELSVEFRAGLLPEDKIGAIRELQAAGHVVLMVGDGINDAPALAQADIGVAMGVAGSDAALEAAPVALMRDDWLAVPEAVRIGRRTFRTIQQNLILGVFYNVIGISLAAFGLLPPVAAAAGQSAPDLIVMLNSARLLRGPRRAKHIERTHRRPGSHLEIPAH
jgi:Cd2+/Zn2+-exporting ATPase/Cu+-exporting ATPase